MFLFLAQAAGAEHHGGEVNLVVPDLSRVTFLNGISGPTLLMGGLLVALLGMVFGLVIYQKLRNLPVHSSMREISELIYETCKTYLLTQGKFLMILEIFIGAAIIFYFGFLQHLELYRVLIILIFSIIGILGSFTIPYLLGPTAPQMLGPLLQATFADYREPLQADALAVISFLLAALVGMAYVIAVARRASSAASGEGG